MVPEARNQYLAPPGIKSLVATKVQEVAMTGRRIAEEFDTAAMSEKLKGVNSLIAVDAFPCDVCSNMIEPYEKYCYNTKETIECLGESLQPTRGKRTCTKCSLKAGYLRIARNFKTGKEHPAMLVIAKEEELIIKRSRR